MKASILTLVLFILSSCAKEKAPEQKFPVRIYNEEDLAAKIKIVDTLCINDTHRAENDINKGKLSINPIHIFHRSIGKDSIVKSKSYAGMEIEKLIVPHLQKFGISVDKDLIFHSCVNTRFDHLFNENCYESRMKDEIEKKFGNHFIDSLATIVEREYVKGHPNIIYTSSDFDRPPKTQAINYYTFTDIKEAEFQNSFIYPKGYKFKNEEGYSYTSADFIVLKDGIIKNLIVEATFQNPENEKFRRYFENRLKDFVKRVKWLSPKCSGIPVNAEFSVLFQHK